jgi:hypothetical protein
MRVIIPVVWLAVSMAASTAAAGKVEHQPAQPVVVRLDPYVGDLVTVGLEINGRPGKFLFDTGGGITMLSPAFAKSIGCVPAGQIVTFRMSGERITASKCASTFIRVGSFSGHISPGVFDLNAVLPAGLPKLDGVVSFDAFATTSLMIDLAKGTLHVRARQPRPGRAREGQVSLMREAAGVGLTAFAVADAKDGQLRLLIDSGNLDRVLLSPGAMEQLGLENSLSQEKSITLKLVGLPVQTIKARVADIIYDGALNADTLKRFRITLDFPHARIWYEERIR